MVAHFLVSPDERAGAALRALQKPLLLCRARVTMVWLLFLGAAVAWPTLLDADGGGDAF